MLANLFWQLYSWCPYSHTSWFSSDSSTAVDSHAKIKANWQERFSAFLPFELEWGACNVWLCGGLCWHLSRPRSSTPLLPAWKDRGSRPVGMKVSASLLRELLEMWLRRITNDSPVCLSFSRSTLQSQEHWPAVSSHARQSLYSPLYSCKDRLYAFPRQADPKRKHRVPPVLVCHAQSTSYTVTPPILGRVRRGRIQEYFCIGAATTQNKHIVFS